MKRFLLALGILSAAVFCATPATANVWVYILDNNGNPVGLKHIDNKLRTSSMPYTYDIAEGNVTDHNPIRRFGENPDVGTSWETVSNVGGIRTLLTSAEQLKVVSGDVDDDGDPAGNGAQTVWIQGLDGDYAVISETVTLNGQTAVTTTNSFLRVLKARVMTAGSSGTNEGVISIKNNAADTTLEVISAAEGQSHSCVITVPAGNTAYLINWSGSENSSKGSQIAIWARAFGGAWELYRNISLIDNLFSNPLLAPLSFTEKTDIEIRAKGVLAGAYVSGGMVGWRE